MPPHVLIRRGVPVGPIGMCGPEAPSGDSEAQAGGHSTLEPFLTTREFFCVCWMCANTAMWGPPDEVACSAPPLFRDDDIDPLLDGCAIAAAFVWVHQGAGFDALD